MRQIVFPLMAHAASTYQNAGRLAVKMSAGGLVANLPVQTPPALISLGVTTSLVHAASTDQIAGKPMKMTAGGLVVSS